MIGWILMAVGVVGMIITFTYIRPRRRRGLAQVEMVEEEPAYIVHPDDAPPPHIHTRRDVVEERPVPGRYLGDKLD
jgi:flagellar biosynthesis/type III secretory pathway M-ring protein FliF/YscJ